MVVTALAVASCYRAKFRSDAPPLGCDGLPNEGWQQLCKRFEPEQELIHAGHGQLFGKRSWSCTPDSAYRVHCSAPVDERELNALSTWLTEHAGVNARSNLDHCLFVMRSRLEMLAEPPEPPPAEGSTTFRNTRPKQCK